jgi:hypothetical protein
MVLNHFPEKSARPAPAAGNHFSEKSAPPAPERVSGADLARQPDTRKMAEFPHDQDHRVPGVPTFPHCYSYVLNPLPARRNRVLGNPAPPGTRIRAAA